MEIRNKKGVFPVTEENNTVIVSTMESVKRASWVAEDVPLGQRMILFDREQHSTHGDRVFGSDQLGGSFIHPDCNSLKVNRAQRSRVIIPGRISISAV